MMMMVVRMMVMVKMTKNDAGALERTGNPNQSSVLLLCGVACYDFRKMVTHAY